MESHPLSDLLQDLTQLIAHAGLRLELLADNYLTNRGQAVSGRLSTNRVQQGETYLLHNQASLGIETKSQKTYRENDEKVSSDAFNLYFLENKKRIQSLFPHCDHEQIVAIAIRQFNDLPSADRMEYLRHPTSQMPLNLQHSSAFIKPLSSQNYFHQSSINEKALNTYIMQKGKDNFGVVPFFGHSTIDYPKPYSSSKSTYSQQTIQRGKMMDQYKRQDGEGQNKQTRSYDVQSSSRKGEERESKAKNDVYRMVLGGKSSQRQERNENRVEQAKEKAQFQTLKSLFKKLQNNT